jgi:hypothetical protein
MEPTTSWMNHQRTGDSFIMDDISNLPGIKPIDLVHAQRIHMCLGVTTKAAIFHVKAHQDQHKAWEELDKYAQINVLADEQADKING